MAPRVVNAPRDPAHSHNRVKEVTVDTTSISPAGDGFHAASFAKHRADQDDTLEAHYASLERDAPCSCYGGYHYIGHMVEGEDGDEVEVYTAVPCRRCLGNSR